MEIERSGEAARRNTTADVADAMIVRDRDDDDDEDEGSRSGQTGRNK